MSKRNVKYPVGTQQLFKNTNRRATLLIGWGSKPDKIDLSIVVKKNTKISRYCGHYTMDATTLKR